MGNEVQLRPEGRSFDEKLLIHALRLRRQQLGVSQLSLGYDIGCADHLVGKFEAGMRNPSLRMFLRWADALGLDVQLKPRND